MREPLSVLIVDDDDSYRSTLSDILLLNNWNVDEVGDGYKAIDLIRQKFYDAILLDINMPGIDGIKTFTEIKNIQPNAVVFMITAYNADKVRDLLDTGVTTVLQKPFDVEKLAEMISRAEKKGVVLIADASDTDRQTLLSLLGTKGYRAFVAKTGAEAIAYAKNNEIDIVLIDMKLPDMDGPAVIEQIKKEKPLISIIATTDESLDGIMDSLTKKGAYSCILKPFDAEIILHEINTLVENRSSLKDPDSLSEARPPKLLLVEDDDGIRETTAAILEEKGYDIKTAASLDEAVAVIQAEVFDLVMSDLSLGTGSGLSLVDPVRKKDPSTIFLLITGMGTMETALEAIKKDVDEYILKPIEPAELVHKVRSYLEKQRVKKEKEALVKQLKQSNVKLMEMARIDELTGAFNRRYMFELLHTEMQRAKRQGTLLCLMMVDVDSFKKYNDTYGHPEGDKLLKEIVTLLKGSLRQYVDQVFRYGGDEFTLLVPNITAENSAALAGRISARVNDALKDKCVGISIGVSTLEGANKRFSLNAFIHDADKKLYEAKKLGGGKAVS